MVDRARAGDSGVDTAISNTDSEAVLPWLIVWLYLYQLCDLGRLVNLSVPQLLLFVK